MLSFRGGRSLDHAGLRLNPRLVAETTDEGTAVANDFGFADTGTLISNSEPEHRTSNAVTGFAPQQTDYLDEIAEAGFPNTETASYIIGKRTFDIVFSAIAIVITAPAMLLIALAIKLSSPGPVFFRQERVGRRGFLFDMLKFRTMRVADKAVTDTAWRALDDPRRTAIGAFLRRTSLDELPQFFNVLKGEMSVVGPRPERPFFVEKFSEEIRHYKLRHNGEVGITGLAQIRGFRGDTCIQSRIACDLEYLETWTLGLDLKIIWGTIKRVFVSDHE